MTGFVPDKSSCCVPAFVLGAQLSTDSENKASSNEEDTFDHDHHSNVPSFIDPHCAPRNIKRREIKNIKKVHLLRSEVKQLKRKVSDYEKVIGRLQQEIKTVKNNKDKSLKHLQKQYELSSLDFMKLEAEFETHAHVILDKVHTTLPSHSPLSSSEFLPTFQTKHGKRYSPII